MWGLWWAWIAAGFVIGIVEVALPGFIFLGFAGGAIVVGVLLGTGVIVGESLSFLLMTFAIASVLVWGGLRLAVGKRSGQVKIWEKDINDT